MRRWIRGTLACLGMLALSAGVMRSRAPQNSQTDSAKGNSPSQSPKAAGAGAATQSTGPVIRTTTRLVQISVAVTDKRGLPVTGLKKEDFTILDGGAPQKVAVFSAEAPVTASQPPRTLPPNIFTNRHDRLGEPPGSKCVLFLDALNTSPQDQEYARAQVLKFLKTIQPQDHFAIYALLGNWQVVILHEFTQDDSELVKAIKEFNVKQPERNMMPFATAADFTGLPPVSLPIVPQDQVAPQNSRGSASMRDQRSADFLRYRSYPLVSALIHMANHLAAIPGRKNFLWVTGGIPLSPSLHDLPDKVKLADLGYRLGEPKFATTQEDLFNAVIQSYNAANVVMYGIDVKGLQQGVGMSGGMDSSNRSAPRTGARGLRGAMGSMAAEQNTRDTYRLVADGTGGNAFYGNNDIVEGMTKAFDDGRYSYMIGYYPDHGSWDGKFRKIQVKVNDEKVHARYRNGYYATADAGVPEDAEKQMQEMVLSPLDSSALSLMVSGQHVQPTTKRELAVQVGVDVAQLLLQHADGHWKGGVDLMFAQKDEKTQVVAAEKKHIELDFTDAKYQELQARGVIFERHLALVAEAEEVRVLVRDAGSGQIGTVSVPLKRFFLGDAGAENSKAK